MLPAVECSTGSLLVSELRPAASWTKEACIMGIDEAGRGPVLGAMVYATVFAPKSLDISKRRWADSKTLTAEKRNALFADITQDSSLGWCYEMLSAELISNGMLARDKVSLNTIAYDSTVKIIQTVLNSGANITEVYIDTVGDAGRYQEKLSGLFPMLQFTVCPKADALYPVVSAASIVAKVVRDKSLEHLQAAPGDASRVPLGSGYPGDPDTKAWLKANVHTVFGFPNIVRFSWETCSRMLDEEAVPMKFEADEDAPAEGQGQQRLTFAPAAGSGGSAKGAAALPLVETSGLGRHTFFRFRKLQRMSEVF